MIKDKKDLKINALENSNSFNLYICIEEQDSANTNCDCLRRRGWRGLVLIFENFAKITCNVVLLSQIWAQERIPVFLLLN